MTDEKELIHRAQSGDTAAFRALVERSRLHVFRLAYDMTGNRHDAEDLSQDVFVKAYRSLHAFRGDAKWSTWLYRITMNACLDHRGAASRKPMNTHEPLNDEILPSQAHAGEVTPDRAAESRILGRHIDAALGRLSNRERAVFTLRHYHDLPLKEIASALEITEGSVKSYLFRALAHLQEDLSFYRNDPGMEHAS